VAKIKRAQPRWVTTWFILDAVVALAPPLYWTFDGDSTQVYGVPAAVFYFVAVATSIAASIVAAYWAEARTGDVG
jgi:putative effector of murein hydrolase